MCDEMCLTMSGFVNASWGPQSKNSAWMMQWADANEVRAEFHTYRCRRPFDNQKIYNAPIRSGSVFKSPELRENTDVNLIFDTTCNRICNILLPPESNSSKHKEWDTVTNVDTHREGKWARFKEITSLVWLTVNWLLPTPSFRPRDFSSCSIWGSAVLLSYLLWQTSEKLC